MEPSSCHRYDFRCQAARHPRPRLLAAIRMFRNVGKVHPDTPHRHLSQVAVHPAAQGQGVGSVLMRAYCDSCDGEGLRVKWWFFVRFAPSAP